MPALAGSDSSEIYEALSAYLTAFMKGSDRLKVKDSITKPAVFRAAMLLFTDAAQRVKDRFGKPYTVDNCYEVMKPMFSRINASNLSRPGNSHKELHTVLSKAFKTSFTL